MPRRWTNARAGRGGAGGYCKGHDYVEDTPVAMSGAEGKPVDLGRADRALKGNAAVASGESRRNRGRKRQDSGESEGYTHNRPVHGYC